MTRLFAASALALQEPPGLLPARIQMGLTLAFHIAFACLETTSKTRLLKTSEGYLDTRRTRSSILSVDSSFRPAA